MMQSTPPPVSSPGSGFFFGDSASSQKKDERKSVENPFLSRNSMSRFSPAQNAMPLHTRQNSPSVANTLIPLSQNTGLRQRKPPRTSEPKGTGLRNLPPLPVSVSLGATVDTMASVGRSPAVGTPLAANTPTAVAPSVTVQSIVATPSENALVQANQRHNGWVLVYGYTSQNQYEELVRRFSSFGHVLKHTGSCQPGRANWIAFQYESTLEAEKALCHQHLQLMDGIFCGVKRLADNDPILSQAANAATLSSLWNDEKTEKGQGPASAEEKDILLSPTHPTLQTRRKRSVCEELAMWFFSMSDDSE